MTQALGRCNRTEDDRAVYILSDPEFVARFSQQRLIRGLPDEVRADVAEALRRSDDGFGAALDAAQRFLEGESFPTHGAPPLGAAPAEVATAANEVEGLLALWREDYQRAAQIFDRVAAGVSGARELRAFWLAFRALALLKAARYGDQAAATEGRTALRSAVATGASSAFFTRLRHSELRLAGTPTTALAPEEYDEVFQAWDSLVSRHGANGPHFDRWCERFLADLQSDNHDVVARTVARIGEELLGLPSEAPQARSGEHDAHWDLPNSRHTLAFEVKLAPQRQSIVIGDVQQAEGAARAIETGRSRSCRILIVTPHSGAENGALERLERARLIETSTLVEEVGRLLALLREYRRGWTVDASVRNQRRMAVQSDLPSRDWLWRAVERSTDWVNSPDIATSRR